MPRALVQKGTKMKKYVVLLCITPLLACQQAAFKNTAAPATKPTQIGTPDAKSNAGKENIDTKTPGTNEPQKGGETTSGQNVNWAAIFGGITAAVTNNDPKPPVQTGPQSEVYFDCSKEFSASSSHSFPVSAGGLGKLNVAQSCVRDFDNTQVSETKTPVDIVFVIDVSSSMTPHIETIRQNIAQFVSNLTQRGWDARFAGIGYSESIRMSTGFLDGNSFQSQVANWRTNDDNGNTDLQENGTLGLNSALDLFAQDSASHPARAPVDKVILFVSDAMTHDGFVTDATTRWHGGFGTAKIANRMNTLRGSTLPGLKFYYSTPDTFARVNDPVYPTTLTYTIRSQYQQLASASQLPGKALNFPFTKDVFTGEFSAAFEKTGGIEHLSCVATAVQLKNKSGKSIGTIEGEALTQANAGWITMSDAAAVKGQSVTLSVSRCCVSSGGTNCKQATTRQNSLQLD